MGDRIHTRDEGISDVPQEQPPKVMQITPMTRVTDKLQDGARICFDRQRFVGYRRYVPLNKQDMFNSLVELYTIMFQTQWQKFKRLVDSNLQGEQLPRAAAERYISCWFHDLYVSNRDSAVRLSPIAFQEYFQHEEVYYLTEYDSFLVLLNAQIRPTQIHGTPEATLWIPLISSTINWSSSNPFGINHYNADYNLTRGLVDIMKESRRWTIQDLVTSVTGRPSWLFDWHDDQAYAWFHREGNYNNDDVAIAYIIGVACTPKLAMRDVDEWQSWENNQIPAAYNVNNLNRIIPRRWHGSIDIRTIELREMDYYLLDEVPRTPRPLTRAQKAASRQRALAIRDEPATQGGDAEASTGRQATLTTVNEFQITDWTYHLGVLKYVELHSRTGALKSIIFS